MPLSASPTPAPLTVITDAACTRCGCVCDDIELTVAENRITAAKRACALGESWYLNRSADDRPECLIDGKPAKLAEGIERAAKILAEARYPLIYGLSETACEAQRVAVAIADWIGGTVDTSTSTFQGPIGVAFQGVGEVTSTLGEIANRGDFILYWGTDPVESHPRHLERYSLSPQGMFLPGGRADRTAVLVDVRHSKTADEVDHFYQIKPDADFEALWTLRALAQGYDPDPAQVLAETGIELARWQELMDQMMAAKFGVILFGAGLCMTRGRHLNAEAVLSLVRDMNAFTRFVAKPMRGRGNIAGADNVVTWQTGYPFGVNLSRGYPRYNPGEFTADHLLARGEVDAALIVAESSLTHLSEPATKHLQSIPVITLGLEDPTIARSAKVAFATATYGIHTPGTVYRMDDVPIPLRPAVASTRASDLDILSAIERCVKDLKFTR